MGVLPDSLLNVLWYGVGNCVWSEKWGQAATCDNYLRNKSNGALIYNFL